MDNFVHLHCHSNFSLLDGLIKIPDLFNKVKALGQPAIAITDHGNCASIFDAQAIAQKTGIKYIPGCEVYCVPDAKIKSKEERSSETDVSRKHLILLAKNNEGYKRLIKIASWGMTDGFYFRPRIDDSILEKYGTEGLIASSACFVPNDNLDVLTKDGIKNLLDIKAGDYVQSHTGEWQKVICPTTREYEGNFYIIKVQGGLPLTVTENHKFFILTKEQLQNYIQYPLVSFINDINFQHEKLSIKQMIKRNLRQYIPHEIEAKNIKVGDYVISSIDETINDIQEMDINFVYQEQCKKHLQSYKLQITNELLELIGIYIAEGSLHINIGIDFSLNIKNQYIQNKVEQYMFNIFGLIPYKHQNKNSDCIIYSYLSKEIYILFNSWFQQGAKNKHIPNFIKYLPFSKQMHCIKGIFLGDGHIQEQLDKRNNKKYTRIIFNTISKQLIYDILHILNRNWINPLIKFKKSYIDKIGTNHQNSYYLYINNPIATYFKQFLLTNIEFKIDYKIWRKTKCLPFEWNGKKYLKYPIKSIKSFYDKKQVYCLNVEKDHTFTICNIKVFNCIAGSISQYILRGQYNKAKKKALYYQQLFNGNFYLELMPHLNKQIDANKGLIQLSKDTGIKLILTSDAHYLNKEDKEAHEVLLAVQTRATMDDPNRWKFEPGYYYIMNRAELTQIMKEKHSYISDDILNEAMDNTVKIAEQCNVEFDFSKHYLPKIDPYKELQSNPQLLKEFNIFETRRLAEVAKRNSITIDEAKARLDTSNEMVRFLCIHGYNGLYKQHFIDAKHLSLFLYELDTIISLGFSSYFLILYEIQYFCNQADILVGFSRGCSSKDNKVKTLLKGLVNIDQIKKDDRVLGLDNQYHKVLRTYEYACDEDLIQIKTENNKQIEGLTKDHKVLGLKKEDYIEKKEYTINDFKWYEIDELDIDDYIIEID